MKIINETNYVTKDLKKIFTQCERTQGIVCDSLTMKRLVVTVKHTKQSRGCSGNAYIGGYRMTIRIPNFEYYFTKADDRRKIYSIDGEKHTQLEYLKRKRRNISYEVAWVFCHELQHIRGLRHKDICDSYDLEWVKTYTIGIKTKTEKKATDIRLKRYDNVLKHVKEAESKVKRWQKILKKWQTKKKYYEKVLTQEGKKGEEQ